MDKFTASNGAIIHRTPGGKIALGNYSQLDAIEEQAWREFFQAERDEELGRWRWPENRDYVVYARRDDTVLVLFELHGEGGVLYRRGDSVHDFEGEAARAYFEAHPEPKPWHDAKTGEIWVITFDGEESAWTVSNAGRFESPDSTFELTASRITAARRIWPESD